MTQALLSLDDCLPNFRTVYKGVYHFLSGMKHFLTVALIFLVVSVSEGQEVSFRLLLHSGEVRVHHGMELKDPVAGLLIYPGEHVVIGNRGYMALVHVSGSILELKESGTYKISDLEKMAESADAYPYAMQYAEFTSFHMTPETKKNRLVASAYQVRSEVPSTHRIRIYIPSAVKVLNDQVFLRWESVQNGNFDMVIRDIQDKELLRKKVTENETFLDMSHESLINAKILLVHIEVEGASEVSSDTYALKRLSDTDRIQLEEEVRDVASGVNPAELLILAGFYESKNLLADAQMCYYKALKLAPNIRGYRDAYDEFLLRNHLVRF